MNERELINQIETEIKGLYENYIQIREVEIIDQEYSNVLFYDYNFKELFLVIYNVEDKEVTDEIILTSKMIKTIAKQETE